MSQPQPAILEPLSPMARSLRFRLRAGAPPSQLLATLAARELGNEIIGLGTVLVAALGKRVPGLRDLPLLANSPVAVPSTPSALWVLLRGDDRGQILHRALAWQQAIAKWCVLEDSLDLFTYEGNRDLSGYEDGTENPEGEKALAAAVLSGAGPGLDGSSFVAVQRWEHDLGTFQALSESARDDVFGRRRSDNEEFDSAPASAHVKRAAQESYEPEAFVLRRSMPWGDARGQGLLFVAFGHSLDAFEAILKRMVGLEDGVVDGLFTFTRPIDGGYYWCPPTTANRLDLSALR